MMKESYFDKIRQYPENYERANPPDAYWYSYVNYGYTRGFANCIHAREAWLLQRYTRKDKGCHLEDLKKEFDESTHNFDIFEIFFRKYIDDIVLFGEINSPENEQNDVWGMAWLDQDISDCQVAQMPKRKSEYPDEDWSIPDKISWRNWLAFFEERITYEKMKVSIGKNVLVHSL